MEDTEMPLQSVTVTGNTEQQDASLRNALSVPEHAKGKFLVAIELQDQDEVVFTATPAPGDQIKIEGGPGWPIELVIDPVDPADHKKSLLATVVKIKANGVPAVIKNLPFDFLIKDSEGNPIDPIIIPR